MWTQPLVLVERHSWDPCAELSKLEATLPLRYTSVGTIDNNGFISHARARALFLPAAEQVIQS